MSADLVNSSFHVFYGVSTIGSAVLEPVKISAQGATTLDVRIAVDHVPEALGMEMLGEILRNENQLNLTVEGHAIARAKGFNAQCNAKCILRVDVSQLPETHFTYRS